MKSALRLSLPALLLVSCTSVFGEQSTLDSTIERYYEAHASERGGQCLAPYIDGITRTEVVENDPERLVVDVRYLYRDRLKDQPSGMEGDGLGTCTGYNQRRFVVANSEDGLEVEAMSGPSQN